MKAILSTFAKYELLTNPVFWHKLEKIRNNSLAKQSMYSVSNDNLIKPQKIVNEEGGTQFNTTSSDAFMMTQQSLVSNVDKSVEKES